MRMLYEDVQAARFRPPAEHLLTGDERTRLRVALSAVVDALPGATELGLRLTGIDQRELAAEACAIHYRGGEMMLALCPRAAAGLVCYALGGAVSPGSEVALSEIDLALLDAWAGEALPTLGRSLAIAVPEVVRCRPGTPDGCVAVAELCFAGDEPAGMVVFDAGTTRRRGEREGTLGDDASCLRDVKARVAVEIPEVRLTLVELLGIGPGDVLVLGRKSEMRGEMRAGALLLGSGRPGARSGSRALRLVKSDTEQQRAEQSRVIDDGY